MNPTKVSLLNSFLAATGATASTAADRAGSRGDTSFERFVENAMNGAQTLRQTKASQPETADEAGEGDGDEKKTSETHGGNSDCSGVSAMVCTAIQSQPPSAEASAEELRLSTGAGMVENSTPDSPVDPLAENPTEPLRADPAKAAGSIENSEVASSPDSLQQRGIAVDEGLPENSEKTEENGGFSPPARNQIASGELAEKARGTVAAQQLSPMSETDNAGKSAGQTQDLPGSGFLAEVEARAPQSPEASSVSTRLDHHNIGPFNASEASAAETVAVESAAASVTGDVRVNSFERLHEGMALQALRLRESKADSLHVVIQPGSDLQLSLQLRQHAGIVEVQAQLQSGDFDQLNRHWKELQQQLEGQGVRLAALTDGQPNLDGNSHNFNQSPQHSDRADEVSTYPLTELAWLGEVGEKVASAPNHRGWQTWA